MSSRIHDDFVSSAPSAPDAESLAAVRAMAKQRARRPQESPRFRSLRAASSLALVATVVVAVALGMAFRGSEPAFASARAIAALVPQGSVLHAVWELTTAPEDLPEQTISGEDWLDTEAERARSVMRGKGEELNGIVMTISQGDHVRGLDRDTAGDAYRIIEYDLPFDSNARFGGYVELLVDGLNSGEVQVVDQVTIDGEPYWSVEMETGDERVSAILNARDYRLKDMALHRLRDGQWVQEVHFSFTAWEAVSRESLPSGFFDFAQIDQAAPAGTKVQAEPGMNQ